MGAPMRTALAVLLVSSVAIADPPTDTPVIEDLPGVSVRLRPGEPAPFQGQLLSEDEQLRRGRRLAAAEATLAKAEQSQLLPLPALIGIIAASVALGAAVGVGVALVAQRR